jgi:hypothetical protein
MKKISVCVLVLAMLLLPGTARAGDWWDYFDRLSGPGPFRGNAWYWPEVRVVVLLKNDSKDKDKVDPSVQAAMARDDADVLRLFVTARLRSMTNEEERRNRPEDPANATNVRLTPFDAALMFRIPDIRGAIDVGAAFTALTFSGGGFEQFTAFGVTPRVTITPGELARRDNPTLRTALRAFKVYLELTLTRKFTASDFGGTVAFSGNEGHAHPRISFGVDLIALASLIPTH